MSTYCLTTDIDLEYGAANVTEWADIDNDASAVTIAARKTRAIAFASEFIDDLMRTSKYRIPLSTYDGTSTVTPPMITYLAAILAGVWLYESRGAADYSQDGTPMHGHAWKKRWAESYLESIVAGQRNIDAVLGQ